MVRQKITVSNKDGLHMRPASELCKKALGYDSKITLRFRNKEFNAKSLLSILSACVQRENEIEIECSGSDEEEAMKGIEELIQKGFEEM